MALNLNTPYASQGGEIKTDDFETKPYPMLSSSYNYQMPNNFDQSYYSPSFQNFSPTSPTFSQYGTRYPNNGYYSSEMMSPMRSPVTSQPQYNFNSYPQLDASRGLNLTIDPMRRQMRELPPPGMRNTLANGIPILPANHATTMGPAYPTTPLQYNDQVQFLSQNPQYLSGLAGQALGTGGKVSRAIAAQLFAKDENTDRFPCTLCGQSFKRINGLKRHLMMHLHIKPYKCEACHRGFCRIDVFKRHVHRARCIKD